MAKTPKNRSNGKHASRPYNTKPAKAKGQNSLGRVQADDDDVAREKRALLARFDFGPPPDPDQTSTKIKSEPADEVPNGNIHDFGHPDLLSGHDRVVQAGTSGLFPNVQNESMLSSNTHLVQVLSSKTSNWKWIEAAVEEILSRPVVMQEPTIHEAPGLAQVRHFLHSIPGNSPDRAHIKDLLYGTLAALYGTWQSAVASLRTGSSMHIKKIEFRLDDLSGTYNSTFAAPVASTSMSQPVIPTANTTSSMPDAHGLVAGLGERSTAIAAEASSSGGDHMRRATATPTLGAAYVQSSPRFYDGVEDRSCLFVFNTPDLSIGDFTHQDVEDACCRVFGPLDLPGFLGILQTNANVWIATFAQDQSGPHRQPWTKTITIKGHEIKAEYHPRKEQNTFICDVTGSGVPTDRVSYYIRSALQGNERHRPRLLVQHGDDEGRGRYLLLRFEHMPPCLRFYIPMETASRKPFRAKFVPWSASKSCMLCEVKHGLAGCPLAREV